MKKIASKEQKNTKPEKEISAHKEKGWIKFIRVLIYVVSIIGVTVGASLIKIGGLSAAYADGTYAAKINNGGIIFFVSLIILCGNIMWGILRWFLRGYREKWKPGRIIGKLIGGGIWRILMIVPLVLLSFLVIAPKISDLISVKILNSDTIKENVFTEPLEQLEYISNHLEDYTAEELKKELAPFLLSNVDFDIDAGQNRSATNQAGFFTKNAYAEKSNVTVLNKAKLSNSGHFVVFYTDTGDEGISDEDATNLGDMLEEIIIDYQNNLDFEYKYEKVENYNADISARVNISSVLFSSGLEQDILDTAMPVYVVNPYESDTFVLAQYINSSAADYLKQIIANIFSIFPDEYNLRLIITTPTFPYIIVFPDNIKSEGLPSVVAHELGHHYEAIYSYDKYNEIFKGDNFVVETFANWGAINALPDQPINNFINRGHYNEVYLKHGTGYEIDHQMPGCDEGGESACIGYPAVAFLQNYANIVPNSPEIMLDAVYYGDALNRLYNKAGKENFQKVMVSLAEKNLTGDYDGKLVNYTLPKGEELLCTDLCTKKYTINPAATEYLYFSVDEYRGAKLTFSGDSGTIVSVLGVGGGIDDTWQVLQSGLNEVEFEFTDVLAQKYRVVAFAVANSNIDSSKGYDIGITSVEFERLIDVAGEFDFSGLYEDLGQGCFEMDLNSLLDLYENFMDLGDAVIDMIAKIDDTTDYSALQNEWTKETNEVKGNIEEARQNIAKYRVSVCANYIKSGQGFDDVKGILQSAMGWNMNLYDEKDGTNRISVFFGFDLLTQQGKVYVLAESDGEMGLITINVSEKY